MPPREREEVEREDRDFEPELRLAAALGFAALLVEGLPPDLAADDFEREEDERDLLAPELRDVPDLLPLDRLDPLLLPPLLLDALVSIDHLPLITLLAASVTASAISAPSLVALDNTDLAALSAVSAASIPASRIALRAFGLALIAAAAAARPAASISLLIAAFASRSVVLFDEPDDRELELDDLDPAAEDRDLLPEDLDPVLLLDLAITNLPWSAQ
ncbi:MAG TPA: hypothetical protein VFT61_11055 [Sphingomicrobium sp.]|nr:hypothetical protein [Sphingomicrobium sp.]